MFDGRAGRGAATIDADRGSVSSARIKFPDLKVAFEHDRPSVVADARPQHAAIQELRHLSALAAQLPGPDILCATAIGNVIYRPIVLAPHRPHFFRAAVADLLVARLRSKLHQPDFTLVDVAMASAPPLI